MEEPIFYIELVNQNQTWTAAASTVCVTVVILYPPRLSTMRTWGIFLSSFTEFPGATMRREPRARGYLVYDKPPMTSAALVRQLTSRGLEITSPDRAARYLRHIGYYRFSPPMRSPSSRVAPTMSSALVPHLMTYSISTYLTANFGSWFSTR